MNFEDIYLKQTLRELAPNKADVLAKADCVNIDARGATSILGREIRMPVSAEVCVLNDIDMARIVINVNAGYGKDVISHRAVADNSPLRLKGSSKLELRESYKSAAAYIEHIIGEVRRDILEFLVKELKKKESELGMDKQNGGEK